MNNNSFNFKFFFFIFFFIIFFFITLVKNVLSDENYIVTIVNKIPITKVDVVNRAKLISISIDKNISQDNLKNYYNQSLKTLINEKIIISAGNKINKNLSSIVSEKANQLLLAEFSNSKFKLNEFIKKIAVPKSVLLEKYKAQIIWGIVIKNTYKEQFSKIRKDIDKTLELNKKAQNEDLYDLAEIVIDKKDNSVLLKKINFALENGISFLDIAKQISISSSSKFNGKIGWKNFENLPDFVKRKKNVIKEGDIFTFVEKDKMKLIKVLVKRLNGKLSLSENETLLAQVKFPINFQKQNIIYEKTKKYLDSILLNKNNCEVLKNLKKENKYKLKLKIIKSRIADLNTKVQKIIKNINFFKSSMPIFYGNNGYTYIKCDSRKAELKKIDYKKLKNIAMNKYFLIYSEKLLKRLSNEANITLIENIK